MKVIILAAGKGERLQPLKDFKPKALLPICNKPLIEYQIELLEKHGIDEIAVVVRYLKEEIKLNGVRFYEDRLIKGAASALHAARDFIDRNFVLVYGDLFFDILNFSEIMEKKNSVGIVRVKDVSRYGEVLFEGGYLTGIREKKGLGEGFVNAEIYHFTPTILDFVEWMEESERKEYELTDSVQMLNEKEQVKVIPLNGYWNDIGYKWDFIDANRYMLERI